MAIVPTGFGYARAAEHLRALLAAGVPIGAVLAGGDEGVLIFNRLGAVLPVIDQVDLAAVASCDLVAVEVRPPGYPLTLLADPVALADAFSLPAGEAADAAVLCRTLVDFSNAVVGRAAERGTGRSPAPGAAAPGPAAAGPATLGLARDGLARDGLARDGLARDGLAGRPGLVPGLDPRRQRAVGGSSRPAHRTAVGVRASCGLAGGYGAGPRLRGRPDRHR